MPTIFMTTRAVAVRIYPNDHRPPHVHAVGADSEARFQLLCQDRAVRLLGNFGFSRSQLNLIATELVANIERLCDAWRAIHE